MLPPSPAHLGWYRRRSRLAVFVGIGIRPDSDRISIIQLFAGKWGPNPAGLQGRLQSRSIPGMSSLGSATPPGDLLLEITAHPRRNPTRFGVAPTVVDRWRSSNDLPQNSARFTALRPRPPRS